MSCLNDNGDIRMKKSEILPVNANWNITGSLHSFSICLRIDLVELIWVVCQWTRCACILVETQLALSQFFFSVFVLYSVVSFEPLNCSLILLVLKIQNKWIRIRFQSHGKLDKSYILRWEYDHLQSFFCQGR